MTASRLYHEIWWNVEKHIHAIYEEMGLTETAIQTIAASRPQCDVYYAHEELGQRLISLAHGPFTLACIARNDAEDHALMDALYQQEGREGFAAAYFRRCGYPDAARRVEAWWQRRREAEARAQERARERQEREGDEATLSVGDEWLVAGGLGGGRGRPE